MKKIISLLSVFAMIATMFTTVAFADENNAIYWVKDGDIVDNVLTLKLMIKTNENLKAAGARYNLKNAYEKGLTKEDVTITETGADITANIMDTSVKAISFNLSTTSQDKTGDIHVLTATFNLANATGDFVLDFAKAFSASNTAGTRLTNFTADTYTVVKPTTGPTLVENDYVFSFTADQDTDVKITHSETGDRTYDLPNFVEGAMEVWGLLKIKDSANIKAGDTFTIQTVKNREVTGTVKTITVK